MVGILTIHNLSNIVYRVAPQLNIFTTVWSFETVPKVSWNYTGQNAFYELGKVSNCHSVWDICLFLSEKLSGFIPKMSEGKAKWASKIENTWKTAKFKQWKDCFLSYF